MTKYVPVMLNLQHKAVLLVGGGHIAWQKYQTLKNSGATITVVSPQLAPKMHKLYEAQAFTWLARPFEAKDVQEKMLIYAVTNDDAVNATVEAAALPTQLVNRADKHNGSNFISTAAVTRGDLVIAVSTSGANPGLARKIKNDLAVQFDDSYTAYVDFLAQQRLRILALTEPGAQRNTMLRQLLAPEILQWTENGDDVARAAFVEQIISKE